MADKTTTSYVLKAEWLFTDGDTRVLTVKNPRENIVASEITELEKLIMNAEEGVTENETLLIGDRTGAPFRRINTVVRETTTTIILDIDI